MFSLLCFLEDTVYNIIFCLMFGKFTSELFFSLIQFFFL